MSTPALIGVAGSLRPAHIPQTLAAVGVAGANTSAIIQNTRAALGIAGEPRGLTLSAVELATSVTNASAYQQSGRIGDQAAIHAWQRGCWFSAFDYLVKPDRRGGIMWKEGRESIFGRLKRRLPVFIDNCGYTRELSEKKKPTPAWVKKEELYPAIIDCIQPDGYAAWDYPREGLEYKQRTMEALQRLMAIYPEDITNGRMWPVFSVRWTFEPRAGVAMGLLPGWGNRPLHALIPLNKTQESYTELTRDAWARLAVGNALLLASDPDFRFMVERFGRVMLGGLVRGPIPRLVRHLFVAALCQLFPDTHFWLLGQANFMVVNGLASLGLLDRVWCDGTWYLMDARADSFAVLDQGLITMNHIRTEERGYGRQSFFTMGELMAANLRALMAGYTYGGDWWPVKLSKLPLDRRDVELMTELRGHFRYAQQELGLYPAKEAA